MSFILIGSNDNQWKNSFLTDPLENWEIQMKKFTKNSSALLRRKISLKNSIFFFTWFSIGWSFPEKTTSAHTSNRATSKTHQQIDGWLNMQYSYDHIRWLITHCFSFLRRVCFYSLWHFHLRDLHFSMNTLCWYYIGVADLSCRLSYSD